MWSFLLAVFARFVANCILFTELIVAEGARSSKMPSHFLRAVFYSRKYIQSPEGVAGQVRPRRRAASRMLSACPRFAEHPGAEINGQH